MAWTHDKWAQDDSINSGYPYLNTTTIPQVWCSDGQYVKWKLQDAVIDGYPHLKNTTVPQTWSSEGLNSPWALNQQILNGYPHLKNTAVPLPMGACCMCEGLYSVTIPSSVLSIGRYAFWGTALTTARIAPACEYFPTTFPTDCEIYHYTDGSNLVDSTGRYLLTKDKKLLKAKEVTNG